jgi:hypothetical protein
MMYWAGLGEPHALDITANPIRSELQGFALPDELIDLSFSFLSILSRSLWDHIATKSHLAFSFVLYIQVA